MDVINGFDGRLNGTYSMVESGWQYQLIENNNRTCQLRCEWNFEMHPRMHSIATAIKLISEQSNESYYQMNIPYSISGGVPSPRWPTPKPSAHNRSHMRCIRLGANQLAFTNCLPKNIPKSIGRNCPPMNRNRIFFCD